MNLIDNRCYAETKSTKAISIIITTIKDKILTLESLEHCPVPYEVIISSKPGLGFARNWGAKQAKNDLLVFLDDDLHLRDEIWQKIMSVQKGEFKMALDKGFPITRVMAIHKEDFWGVGGFDEQFRFTSEDRDFYVRAIMKGMRFKGIPINLTIHQPHIRRSKNIHIAIRAVSENVQFIRKYAVRFPEIWKIDFLDRLRQGQIRTLLIQVLLFYYYILK
ncbi:MAG: galactosyltransferase-related protein [Candidatus Bathyarchaeia archaeon]